MRALLLLALSSSSSVISELKFDDPAAVDVDAADGVGSRYSASASRWK